MALHSRWVDMMMGGTTYMSVYTCMYMHLWIQANVISTRTLSYTKCHHWWMYTTPLFSAKPSVWYAYSRGKAWNIQNSISYFQNMLTGSFSSTLDPAIRRAWTTSAFPLIAAQWSGVFPVCWVTMRLTKWMYIYLHTAMNSWKMYHIHAYSRVDAVIWRGVGTWKIDIHIDGGQMLLRHTWSSDLLRIHSELSTYTVALS